jgi:ComEC/Rec2-related protein
VLKIAKNEKKPKSFFLPTIFASSNGQSKPPTDQKDQYIKDKHTISLSRFKGLIDRLNFWLKRLINGFFDLLEKLRASVKYRYLQSQKALAYQRQFYLKRLEGLIGARGLPLVKGLLFGDLSSIDQGTYHSFKVIGILHILSASSANFTIFLEFCLFFIKPITPHLTKNQHFGLRFLIIFLYFSLVGSAASTFRAFLTLSFGFFAFFLLKRSFLPLFNLYLAAIFMLIINPMYLETLSFQFSFLASFAILFLYNFFEKEPFISHNYLLKNILLTACVQFFLAPVLIANFGELNYLAILANLVVLPLVEILTTLFLASFIVLFITDVFPLTFIESLLSYLISKLLDILFFLINLLEKIPYKSLTFNQNKDLFTAIFILIDFVAIIYVKHLKDKRYSKNKYRIFR